MIQTSKRTFLRLAVAALVVAGAAVWCAGCAELPDIPEGVCGNSIVEEGEDCDAFAPSGQSCRAAGAAGGCRWDCTSSESGSQPACPEGWGCGADAICRAHTGRFALGGEPVAALALDQDDFDGDLRRDLVTFTGTDIQVHYYDGDGSLANTFSLSANLSLPLPAYGDLSGDGRSDAVVKLGDIGLGVLTSTPERTLVPVVQSSIPVPLPTDGSRLIPLDALDAPGDETLAILAADGGGFGVFAINPDENEGEFTKLFLLPKKSALDIHGNVPSGDFDNDPARPCPELVFGFQGENVVRVYTPCLDGDSYDTSAKPRLIQLPPGDGITGALFVADANGDGHLDLLVPVTTQDFTPGVDIAYGVGDGSFHSDPATIPDPGPGDDAASFVVALYGGRSASSVGAGPGGPEDPPGAPDSQKLVLGVGYLDGDNRADLVTPNDVWLAIGLENGKPVYEARSLGGTGSWTSAAIADFNGNGLVDVMLGSQALPGIEFHNGNGSGVFNRFELATQRPVRHFAAGDFDGDLITDLAFAEVSGNEAALDSLSFAFGRPFAAPESPVTAGELRGIQQIATGDRLMHFLFGSSSSADAMMDLAIVSLSEDGEEGFLTVVPGSSDRRLQSPYVLLDAAGGAPALPMLTAIGQLTTNDRLADLAVFGIDLVTFQGGLWLVPSAGEGKFATPVARNFGGDFDVSSAGVAVGDLDLAGATDSLDEIVVAAAAYGDGGELGAVITIRADGAGGFEDPVVTLVEQALGYDALGATLADLDGDGYADLVARAQPFFGYAEGDMTAPAQVWVYWNDGGTLNTAEPTSLPPIGDGFVEVSLASLNADQDPEAELVLASPTGAWLFHADASRTFGEPERLGDVPGSARVVAGDFNGDGVDDLAVSSFDTGLTSLLLGVAVRP